MLLTVRIINNEKQWGDLVGFSKYIDNKKIFFYQWEESYKKLKVSIDVNGNGIAKVTEHISLALGEERFLETLKQNYDIDVIFVEAFSFSEETILKAQGLIQAGFEKLVLVNGTYMVDGIFPQSFLTEEELGFLLTRGAAEKYLHEIQ